MSLNAIIISYADMPMFTLVRITRWLNVAVLKGFAKTQVLAAGASEDVYFGLTARDLSVWSEASTASVRPVEVHDSWCTLQRVLWTDCFLQPLLTYERIYLHSC